MKMLFKNLSAKRAMRAIRAIRPRNRVDFKSALAIATLPGIVLLILQDAFIVLDVYERYFSSLDILMHLVGGACVAWAAMVLVAYAIRENKLPRMPFWFVVAFCVGTAITVGVLWEFYEFMNDFFMNTNQQLAQYGVNDTMKDLADDLMGALILSVVTGRKMLKN